LSVVKQAEKGDREDATIVDAQGKRGRQKRTSKKRLTCSHLWGGKEVRRTIPEGFGKREKDDRKRGRILSWEKRTKRKGKNA